MSYQSIQFLIFAAIVLVVYYIAGAISRRLQKYVLLIANVYFYAQAGMDYIPFMLVTLLTTYLAGRWMGRIYQRTDEKLAQCETTADKKQLRALAKKRARRVVVAAFIIAAALLVVCKCSQSIIAAVNELLESRGAEQFTLFSVIMPLGISYYTFMAIGYVLDVYWKRCEAEKNIVTYGAFLIYFPHIVQGPIDRFGALKPQLADGAKLSYKNLAFGGQLILWGLFKKMVIADRINQVVTRVFAGYATYSGSVVLVAAVFAALELYCNFSGCIDIVRGYSQMLGIELAENFDHPFFSKSAAEFWRRWHVSLGAWFRDYVYMPLSVSPRLIKFTKKCRGVIGERAGKAMASVIPTAVVWLLTGFWHGTGWNYIVWGIYWGLMIILSNVFAPEIKKLSGLLRIDTESGGWQVFRMIRTFFLFVAGRIITMPGDLRASREMFRHIFTQFKLASLFDGTLYCVGLDRPNFLLAIAALAVLWAVSLMQRRGPLRERIAESPLVFRWIVYYALIFAIIIFGMYGPGFVASEFVYGNF